MNTEYATTNPSHVPAADQGNRISILLLIIPSAALLFAWCHKKLFIAPADFQNFLLYSLKISSITCLALFVVSFWSTRKQPVLVMIFIVFELYWGFAGIALLPVLNVKYDRSETVYFEKRVREVYRGTPRSSYVRVESWNGRDEYLYPPFYMYDSIRQNSSIIRFSTRSGWLGHEYVTTLEGSM